MNHQDELGSAYKSLSTEQPSEISDQLILQAAVEALKDNSKTNAQTQQKSSSRPAKEWFLSRRWHAPVSLAATAVITISVVSSLKPWQLSLPETIDTAPVVLIEPQQPSKDPVLKLQEQRSATEASREAAIAVAQTRNKQQKSYPARKSLSSDKQFWASIASPIIEKNIRQRSVLEKREMLPLTKSSQKTDAGLIKTEAADILSNSSTSELDFPSNFRYKILSDSTEKRLKINITDTQSLNISQWLELIEKNLQDSDPELARNNVLSLLAQHPMELFSENEAKQFNMLQKLIPEPEND